jgi:hypothetical protein
MKIPFCPQKNVLKDFWYNLDIFSRETHAKIANKGN